MNKKVLNLLYILIFLNIISCKHKTIGFVIDDNYSGPCVIFIGEKKQPAIDNEIYVQNGMGVMNKQNKNFSFFFKLSHSNDTLEVVEIGDTIKRDKSKKQIYMLVEGQSELSDFPYTINAIRFFIGTSNEFSVWNEKYNDEIEYLESKGINWKKYYNENLEHEKK